MITLYALLLLNFVRQSTSPPIDWTQVIVTLVGASGLLAVIAKIFGDSYLARQKAINDKAAADQKLANDAHLLEVNRLNDKAAVDAKEAIASAQAERQQDTNLSIVLVETVSVLKSMAASGEARDKAIADRNTTAAKQAGLLAVNNDLMDTLTEKVASMIKKLDEGRAEIISGISSKMTTKETDDQRYQENALAVGEIKTIVATLDGKVDTIIRRLDESPTVKGHQEATRQILDVLNTVKAQLATIEARLLVSGPPSADSPVSEPEASKPQ